MMRRSYVSIFTAIGLVLMVGISNAIPAIATQVADQPQLIQLAAPAQQSQPLIISCYAPSSRTLKKKEPSVFLRLASSDTPEIVINTIVKSPSFPDSSTSFTIGSSQLSMLGQYSYYEGESPTFLATASIVGLTNKITDIKVGGVNMQLSDFIYKQSGMYTA
jgi:hypothetical protein